MSYTIVEPPHIQDLIAKAVDKANQKDQVLRYTKALCEALELDFIEYSIKRHKFSISNEVNMDYHQQKIDELQNGIGCYEFVIESGRKYHKIIMVTENNNRSAHAFVDKVTGEVYKSASFKSPAKGVRFNLLVDTSREMCYDVCDWSGGYLYRNDSYTG